MRVNLNLSEFFKSNTPSDTSIDDDKIILYAGGFKITITPSIDNDDCPIFDAKFEVI